MRKYTKVSTKDQTDRSMEVVREQCTRCPARPATRTKWCQGRNLRDTNYATLCCSTAVRQSGSAYVYTLTHSWGIYLEVKKETHANRRILTNFLIRDMASYFKWQTSTWRHSSLRCILDEAPASVGSKLLRMAEIAENVAVRRFLRAGWYCGSCIPMFALWIANKHLAFKNWAYPWFSLTQWSKLCSQGRREVYTTNAFIRDLKKGTVLYLGSSRTDGVWSLIGSSVPCLRVQHRSLAQRSVRRCHRGWLCRCIDMPMQPRMWMATSIRQSLATCWPWLTPGGHRHCFSLGRNIYQSLWRAISWKASRRRWMNWLFDCKQGAAMALSFF